MKGHGEKRTRKEEQAISALLIQPTVEAAAAAISVSDVTLWRWLKQPHFLMEYRAARRRVVEHAIARLQRVTGQAVEALSRNLSCGHPTVEVRAALGVLDQAFRAQELMDVEGRLEILESFLPGENHWRNDE